MWLFNSFFPQFCKSDMSRYRYLKVFKRDPWTEITRVDLYLEMFTYVINKDQKGKKHLIFSGCLQLLSQSVPVEMTDCFSLLLYHRMLTDVVWKRILAKLNDKLATEIWHIFQPKSADIFLISPQKYMLWVLISLTEVFQMSIHNIYSCLKIKKKYLYYFVWAATLIIEQSFSLILMIFGCMVGTDILL